MLPDYQGRVIAISGVLVRPWHLNAVGVHKFKLQVSASSAASDDWLHSGRSIDRLGKVHPSCRLFAAPYFVRIVYSTFQRRAVRRRKSLAP